MRREIVLGKFVVLSVGDRLVDLLGRQVAPLLLLSAVDIVHPDVGPDIPDNKAGKITLVKITPPSALDNTIVTLLVAARVV
jgi:hypothetical protein